MKNLKFVIVLAISLLFIACGGSSSDSTTSTTTSPTTTTTTTTTKGTGTIVDPYIVGAILCQDDNSNNTCDSTEPTSTASDAKGSFTFSKSLTPGKNIIIKTQGKHEGIIYDVNLAGKVDTDGNIKVISPLTTFQSKGLSPAQIVEVLTDAGLTGISEASILNDPMKDGLADKKVSELTTADLVNLQASLATYGLLRIIEGSTTLKALNDTQLYTSAKTGNLSFILKEMVTAITGPLNTAKFSSIKDDIKAASSLIPEPTFGILIKTSVAIMDRLTKVGYEACNATSGTDTQKRTAAINAVNVDVATVTAAAKVKELFLAFYGLENKSSLTALISFLPAEIKAGVNSSGTTFRFDDKDNFSAKN